MVQFRELVLIPYPSSEHTNSQGREAIEHFTRIGYPVPHGANAADHFISILTEELSSEHDEKKSRVQSILDAWTVNSVRQPNITREVTDIPKIQDEDDAVPGFALGFFEELWWLTRR